MPNVAALLDEFRAANPGLDFKVTYALDKETGVEVGTPMDLTNAFTIPEHYGMAPSAPPPQQRRKRR